MTVTGEVSGSSQAEPLLRNSNLLETYSLHKISVMCTLNIVNI